MRIRVSLAAIPVACLVLVAASKPDPVLVGPKAFTGFDADAPGVTRLIRPTDLPKPSPTTSPVDLPQPAPMPDGAKPIVGDGFAVELVASGLEEPRAIRTAPNGDLFFADSWSGKIEMFTLPAAGAKPDIQTYATGLSQPYGIAFYPPGDNPQWLYVANTDSVVRFPYKNGDTKASGPAETIVPKIPTGYHWTRDVAFSPDGRKMFVSVGSGSNIGEDVTGTPPQGGIRNWSAGHPLGALWGPELGRANILVYTPDGKNPQTYATGLRNCAGMTIQPETGNLWCVVNERDALGDNVPPDFATSVKVGAFYGWPWFYIGGNQDPRPPLKGQRKDLVRKVTVPDVLIQAHSAPLNIAFYEGSMFPPDYKGNAFVTLHGSWNRDERTGYKIVRLFFKDGKPTGAYQDFMTGFVLPNGDPWGRPVGITVAKDGSLFVTEDGNGTIWRVTAATPGPS